MLRGPQGTLFGRNTPAGAVKFESARPTQEFEGYGRFSYGRFSTSNFEAAVSGPLIPSVLSTRISLLDQRRGDWIDNGHTDEDNDSRRASRPSRSDTVVMDSHAGTKNVGQVSPSRFGLARRGCSARIPWRRARAIWWTILPAAASRTTDVTNKL